jgi:hypothetical protein
MSSTAARASDSRSMCECAPDQNPFAPAGFLRARHTLPSGDYRHHSVVRLIIGLHVRRIYRAGHTIYLAAYVAR